MAKKTNTKVNGKDYYRIRRKVGEDENGKAIMKSFYGDGKKEAEEKCHQYIEELSASPNKNRANSLGKIALFYTYQVLLNENLAPATIELYERQYRTKLAPSKLATKPIKDVTSSDIQKFLNELASGKLDGKEIRIAQSAITSLSKYLRKLFRYLAVEGYCTNLMDNITIPKVLSRNLSDLDHEILVFSEDEISRIIAYPARFTFLFQLALATGLREGELLALKYNDFDGNSIHIRRQLNYHYRISSDGERERVGVIKRPKSTASVRTVPLPDNVRSAFLVHQRVHQEEMWEKDYQTNYVFTTSSGQFLDRANFTRAWRRHLKAAHVPYKKFHSCRSTYCTLLCKRGVPLETASKLMGHSDINITAAYYRFVNQEELMLAADSINDIFDL